MNFLEKLLRGAGSAIGIGGAGQSMKQAPEMGRQLPQAMPMRALRSAPQPMVGQAQVPYSQETADRYNANPQEFVGKNAIDPKYFGYPADNGLRVQQNYGMQGFGRGQEDDYSPSAALENTGYFNPQTTQHGAFRQGGLGNQQIQQDLIRRLLGY